MNAERKESSLIRRVRSKVTEVFGADLRSLAAFRVVLALLVLADLASRVTDLSAHYADEGILPRDVVLEEGILSKWMFSLNLVNGEPLFQALLFGILALAALGLLVGYRTRLMTVVAWVLLLSIQFRNPLLSGAGEPLLRLLLFWAMFLPLGAVWSLDRARKAVPLRWSSTRFLSLGTVGLFMQIAFMYWFTALQKSGAEWRTDGTALYYALSYDQVATPVGTYLLHFPVLLEVLTFATILLEAFGPFLLFCPILTGPVRTGAVLAFMGLHFGIRLSMDIGIFPWISAFCMVCFLPGWFWDKPVAALRAALPKGLTNLGFHLRNAVPTLTRAYHSSLGTSLSPVTGLASGRHHYVMPPASARTRTRVATGTDDGAGHGVAAGLAPTKLRASLVSNLLAAFFLAYIFCWNLTTVSAFTMPERLEPVGYSFGVAQSWSMFAPFPSREDGWFVFPGSLRDGQQVDLLPVTHGDFDPHPVSWEKPRQISSTDKNEHWRKYLQSIRQEEYADQRLYLARYVCREWNARHPGAERLMTFQITYMSEVTQPNYQPSTPQKVVLRDHRCL